MKVIQMQSFVCEVLEHGEWCGNALRFATPEEALAYGRDLLSRWTIPVDCRATESPDPVSHVWSDTGLRRVDEPEGAARMPARRVQL